VNTDPGNHQRPDNQPHNADQPPVPPTTPSAPCINNPVALVALSPLAPTPRRTTHSRQTRTHGSTARSRPTHIHRRTAEQRLLPSTQSLRLPTASTGRWLPTLRPIGASLPTRCRLSARLNTTTIRPRLHGPTARLHGRTNRSTRTVLPLRTGLLESARLSICTGLNCLRWLTGHPIRPGLIPCPIGGGLALEAL
jgi:hypothetical protein